MTSKTARVNAGLKGTLSAEERELQASGMEMLRINATNCLWLPHEAMEDLLLPVGQMVGTAYAMEGDSMFDISREEADWAPRDRSARRSRG